MNEFQVQQFSFSLVFLSSTLLPNKRPLKAAFSARFSVLTASHDGKMFRMKVLSLNGLSSLFSVSNSLEVFRLCCMQPGQVQTKSSCLQASIIETSQNDRSQRKSNVAELKVGLFICITKWGQVLSCKLNISFQAFAACSLVRFRPKAVGFKRQ